MAPPKKVKKGAKPKVTSNFGYLSDGKQNKQIKIATSNLFIETESVPIDYMTGAIFDGIGGNEFINTGSASIILQPGNTLIDNSSDILEETSSAVTEKQPDNQEAVESQFALKLNNYLPETINNKEYIGSNNQANIDGTEVLVEFPERNVYFDETYAYIYIELDNMTEDLQVEVEFITSASLTSDII
jgi:hypothetical protein